jgi:hypothetical protein
VGSIRKCRDERELRCRRTTWKANKTNPSIEEGSCSFVSFACPNTSERDEQSSQKFVSFAVSVAGGSGCLPRWPYEKRPLGYDRRHDHKDSTEPASGNEARSSRNIGLNTVETRQHPAQRRRGPTQRHASCSGARRRSTTRSKPWGSKPTQHVGNRQDDDRHLSRIERPDAARKMSAALLARQRHHTSAPKGPPMNRAAGFGHSFGRTKSAAKRH